VNHLVGSGSLILFIRCLGMSMTSWPGSATGERIESFTMTRTAV